MQQVFISHTARDTAWARSFAKALKERGVSVWFDEFDVQPGESWREALESGLRNSDVFVAVLDAEAPARPNLFFELGAAIGMGKRVGANSAQGDRFRRAPARVFALSNLMQMSQV